MAVLPAELLGLGPRHLRLDKARALFRGPVVEVDELLETPLEARVEAQHVVHLGLVPGEDDHGRGLVPEIMNVWFIYR